MGKVYKLRLFSNDKGSNAGYAHEEILIEDLAPGNVFHCPQQDISSNDEVGCSQDHQKNGSCYMDKGSQDHADSIDDRSCDKPQGSAAMRIFLVVVIAAAMVFMMVFVMVMTAAAVFFMMVFVMVMAAAAVLFMVMFMHTSAVFVMMVMLMPTSAVLVMMVTRFRRGRQRKCQGEAVF